MKRFDIEVQDGRAYLVGNPDGKYVKHEEALETLTALFDVTAQRDHLLAALELLLERIPEPPDANCSCHISPPCNDCVDYAGEREAFEFAKEAISKVKGTPC